MHGHSPSLPQYSFKEVIVYVHVVFLKEIFLFRILLYKLASVFYVYRFAYHFAGFNFVLNRHAHRQA